MMKFLWGLRHTSTVLLEKKIKWSFPTRFMSTSNVADDKSEAEGRHHSEIPGPRSLPYIGTLYKYIPYIGEYDSDRPIEASARKFEKYGNIVREEILPGTVLYHLFDPVDFEKMLRSTGKYPERPVVQSLKKYRSENDKANGLAELNGKEWHRLRHVIQKSMLNFAGVQSFIPLQGPVSDDLVRNIRRLRDPNSFEVNDLMNDLYKWALESISVVIFGKRIGCMDLNLAQDSLPQRFIDTVGSYFTGLGKTFNRWPLHKSGKTKVWKQFVKDLNFLYEVFEAHCDECIERHKEETTGVDPLLISLMYNGNISKADVQTTVADLFFGGVDTTANTLGFLLYNLAKHPAAQEKLYNEIRHKIRPGFSPEPTSFNNAPYLKAVIKENFRLNPTSGRTTRIIQQDTVLAGYKIPKGSLICTQNGVAGRTEKYFESPKVFQPERWLRADDTSNTHPFILLPFGHGPRIYVGRRFAEQELYLGLSAIISNFKIQYHHEDIGIKTKLLSYPDKPLRFTFIDRE